jgi:hypothetical protein
LSCRESFLLIALRMFCILCMLYGVIDRVGCSENNEQGGGARIRGLFEVAEG